MGEKLLGLLMGSAAALLFALILFRAPRYVMSAVWKLLPNGRLKRALFKGRGKAEHSAINPHDPWVQAQWLKGAKQRTNRITAPPEFIEGERTHTPSSGADSQGPNVRP